MRPSGSARLAGRVSAPYRTVPVSFHGPALRLLVVVDAPRAARGAAAAEPFPPPNRPAEPDGGSHQPEQPSWLRWTQRRMRPGSMPAGRIDAAPRGLGAQVLSLNSRSVHMPVNAARAFH